MPMPPKSIVTLSISGTGTPALRTYSFEVMVDGQPAQSLQSLSPVESQEVMEISRQYEHLFEKQCRPEAASDYLEVLGAGLFHLWFETAWGQIRAKISGPEIELVISSDLPEVLGLPWELVHPPDGEILGFDQSIGIRRSPASQPTRAELASKAELPPGPLRVLFVACGPKQSMDCPSEEEALYSALEGMSITLDCGDLGTFEELRQMTGQLRPQIVHLAGQAVSKEGSIYFAFEGKSGMPDLKSASDIMQILTGMDIQCLIMSGCQSKSLSYLETLCQDLARLGIPMVIAWAGSMAESSGFDLIRELYQSLATGQPVSSALVRASQVVGKAYREHSGILAFPDLYSSTGQDQILDAQKAPHIISHMRSEQRHLRGNSDGYAEDFVNRRREQQRLLPALRDGTVRAVILTGPEGTGKSAMAAHLAKEMKDSGFLLITLQSSKDKPLITARLIEACREAFLMAEGRNRLEGDDRKADRFRDAAGLLGDPKSSVDTRLREAVSAMDLGRFCLVLDDFNANLDESGRIRDQDISKFYAHILNHLTNSRAIIVSQRLPEDIMTLPSRVWEHPLGGLFLADFLRHMLRDELAARRYGTGEIKYGLIRNLHGAVSGRPMCLYRLGRALGFGANIKPGTGLCEDVNIFLYGTLSPDSRKALSRAAAFNVPVNLSGLEAVTGASFGALESMADEWRGIGLAFWRDGLLAISSDLRLWLLGQISAEERAKAHRDAGDFLRDISQQKRSGEVGLSRLEGMLEARAQYLAAGHADRAVDATNRISGFLMRMGLFGDIKRLNQEILDSFGHPRAMAWMAMACLEQGQYPEAQDLYQRCLEQASGDQDRASAMHGLAIIDLRQGRYDLARKNFLGALEIFQRLGDDASTAATLQGLASIDMALGENQPARDRLVKVLVLQEKLEDKSGQVATLHDLISLDLRQADYPAAREKLQRSLSIFEDIGDLAGQAGVLRNMASIDLEKGDPDVARSEFQRSLEIRQKLNDKAGQAGILHNMGMIDLQSGDLQSAREKLVRSLKIYQEMGDKPGEASAFFQLGVMAVQGKNTNEGMKLLALSGMLLKLADHPDFKEVEPVVDRLASQLRYSQEQFMRMIKEVSEAYRRDRASGLVEAAFKD
ncbi:MAG TPA: tetratricopeptide repeat protein [Methanotrichaceae archaeon]|nr:tetratricopeptide repeat protein [Methanotrichaceae archaeon]